MTHAGCRRQCGTLLPQGERGYSLVEALIAIAIIGVISLVAVPNFIQFMRTGKIKTAMRQFTSDLRGARQLSVARNMQTKISFEPGPIPANAPATYRVTYTIWQRRGTAPWQPSIIDGRGLPMDPIRELEEGVFFESTSFTDLDSPADGKIDILFLPNGTAPMPPGTQSEVVLKIKHEIPKPTFQVQITPAGAIKAY